VSSVQWLLLAHLLSAFTFVSGAVAAGVLQIAAIRAERPGDVALLLRLVRVPVALVTLGALATLAFGFALVHQLSLPNSLLWIRLAFLFWILSMVLGGIGGRRARHAREYADRMAGGDDLPEAELRRLVADPLSVALSTASFAVVLGIIVLMVWRPT
jgi:uncharacterized membrane protein